MTTQLVCLLIPSSRHRFRWEMRHLYVPCLPATRSYLAWWFARAAWSSKASLVGGNISRALLPFPKRWSLAWCRCAIQVTDKLFNWCEVSIATNSVNEEWLVLEDFPALLLPMTKDEVESQPVRAWKLSRLSTTGLASLSDTRDVKSSLRPRP